MADPRVDTDGFLLRMPAESEAVARLMWASAPTTSLRVVEGEEQLVSVYSSLNICDDTVNDIVCVGDVVYLHPEEVNMPCEIGLITRLFEVNGEKMLTARWFWRQQHLNLPDSAARDQRELFLSNTSDDNPASALERRLTVYRLSDTETLPTAIREAADTFYYRCTYDPQDGRFETDAPLVGNCQQIAPSGQAALPPASTAGVAVALPAASPDARRGKASARPAKRVKAEGAHPTRKGEEDVIEKQKALAILADKVESTREDVTKRIQELHGLIKLVHEEVALRLAL